MTTEKIDHLTPEQEAQTPVYRDEAIAVGLDTSRCDRKEAEKWASEAYKIGQLPPPKIFIWLDNPHDCVVAQELFFQTFVFLKSKKVKERIAEYELRG